MPCSEDEIAFDIDIDEWREVPVRHRYVHASIVGTETRFSVYLPPAEQYEGRFFQHITPVPDNENLAQHHVTGADDKIGFAISSGAYFLETNGGGKAAGIGDDPTVTAYGANAAAAQCSRAIAAEMYGPHRPFGYAYGGSGGAYRTIGSMQNTDGVWDGVVPYVLGSPMAIPNMFTVRLRAMRVLGEKLAGIADAAEPGGGDMYAGLDDHERSVLEEITRMGFPPASWYGFRTMGQHAFPVLFGGVKMADPTYFTDFWTVPGHLGADGDPSVWSARISHRTEVVGLVSARDARSLGLELEPRARSGPWRCGPCVQGDRLGRRRRAARRSAVGRGTRRPPGERQRDRPQRRRCRLDRDDPGDRGRRRPVRGRARMRCWPSCVPVTRCWSTTATCWQWRPTTGTRCPGPSTRRGTSSATADGTPLFPQRPFLLGPLFTTAAAGSVPTGEIKGKMILVEALWDREALPWQADWYRSRVIEQAGGDIDDRFRLWYVDHALHGDSDEQEDAAHTVSYLGVLHQALRDLAAWVERGVAPPASTNYRIDDAQVVVPASAKDRSGIQPVVALTVDGGVRADVGVGATVEFEAVIEVPPNAGTVVAVEWDFAGDATFTGTIRRGRQPRPR